MSDIIKHNNINRDNINTIQYNEFNKIKRKLMLNTYRFNKFIF